MPNAGEKIISQIDKRAEFSILIALFIPTLNQGYLNAIGKPSPYNGYEIVSYSGTIIFLIIDYLLHQLWSESMPQKWLKLISHLYPGSIVSFIIPMLNYSTPDSPHTSYFNLLSILSGLFIILIPVTILFTYVVVFFMVQVTKK